MPFALFENENVADDLSEDAPFQSGVSNFDTESTSPEKGILIPWASEGDASWVYYDVAIACLLDNGVVVHRHLPQASKANDTLSSVDITDANIDKITGRGVNLKSVDDYDDVVQRMAHSRYWFRLYGQAMRVGHQVPIPGLKTVAGVKAIPHDENPQWGYNKIVGNYSGVPLWYAQWSLWYTVSDPPKTAQVPPPNLAAHIAGDVKLPDGMQAPFSQPDDEAEASNPIQFMNPLQGP